MPVERIPIVHKFGIISKSHKEEYLKGTYNEQSNRAATKNCSMTPHPSKSMSLCENVQELVLQLQRENEELLLCQLEEIAKNIMDKIKFKLNSFEKKSNVDMLQQCWKDLSSLGLSMNPRIMTESLTMLQQSLLHSPLTRQVIPILLELGLSHLQAVSMLSNEDVVTKAHSNNELLVETTFILFIRLYYHSKVGDIVLDNHKFQLDALQLINNGLINVIDIFYGEKPIIWSYVKLIHLIVLNLCLEELDLSGSTIEGNATEKDIEYYDESNTKEEAIVDGEKETPAEVMSRGISTFLRSSLKIWKSVTRKTKLSEEVLVGLCEQDLSAIDDFDCLDYVLSFYIIGACAKIKTDFLLLYLRLGFKSKSLTRVLPIPGWPLQLQIVYLKTMMDIALCGLTSDIITSALFGNQHLSGLVDYLEQTSAQGESEWMVRHVAHQFLYNSYMFYQQDAIKDCVRNMIWNVLHKFQERERNLKVLNINKFEEKIIPLQENNVFTKIATNLSIVYLPMDTPFKKNQLDWTSGPPELTKDKQRVAKKKGINQPYSKIQSRIPGNKNSPSEGAIIKKPSTNTLVWSNIQSMVARQFEKEKEEDDAEVERIEQELEGLGLVKKVEYNGPKEL